MADKPTLKPKSGRKSGQTLGEMLTERGVSRRSFLKFASYTASILALPPTAATAIAQGLASARRQSVIWLSFQECTGCTESITRASSPSIEDLIFDFISLDYHHTLQNASGHLAEAAREQAMEENEGDYIVVVDGSIPLDNPGFSTIAGISNRQMLEETVAGAKAVIAVGTCAAFGGIPGANPNPTGAVAVSELTDKPVINISGCPPIPEAMTGTIAYLLSFGSLPELDHLGRPKAFFGEAIHDRCYRRPFYEKGMFAKSFDDEGARQGWCLYEVGCKGPVTYNACATLKWNGGVSFPIQSGHGCLGCSEPGFWDMGGFYKPLSTATGDALKYGAAAAIGGAAIGAASAVAARNHKNKITKATQGDQPVVEKEEAE
jgi:hydrogenase small subunit